MIKLITTLQAFHEWRASLNHNDIGFVPTMGNLHQGHLSLLKESTDHHAVSILSIFVNPTQFGPHEDFNRYPRTLEQDIKLIEDHYQTFSKMIIVFAPQSTQDIYPAGFSTVIQVPVLDGFLEGLMRPGHFAGVATVVYLLLNIVRPRTAYFGRKDYQQYRVVKRMVKDLNLPYHIKGLPIIRDHQGLALSSRNQYLSEQEKKEALDLPQTLMVIEKILSQQQTNIPLVEEYIKKLLQKDLRWQYLEIRESKTLMPIKNHHTIKSIVILAVMKVGSVRLLDNKEVTLI